MIGEPKQCGGPARHQVKERIRFHGAGDFSRLLNERAEVVLGDAATMRRAYRVLWAKSALVMVWAVASYLFLLLVVSTPVPVVAASISLGLAAAAIGFCVMHDANHGGYSTSRAVNRARGAFARPDRRLVVRLGRQAPRPSHLHERRRPRSRHRCAARSPGSSRRQRRRGWHRYQHVYMWVLYAFVTLRWQWFTDASFLRPRIGRAAPGSGGRVGGTSSAWWPGRRSSQRGRSRSRCSCTRRRTCCSCSCASRPSHRWP